MLLSQSNIGRVPILSAVAGVTHRPNTGSAHQTHVLLEFCRQEGPSDPAMRQSHKLESNVEEEVVAVDLSDAHSQEGGSVFGGAQSSISLTA